MDRRAGPGRQGSRHHDRVGVGDGTGGLRPVSFSDGAWSARESNGGEEESAECAVVGRRLPLLGASGKNFPAISRARHAGRGTLARRLVSSAVPGGVGHIYVIYEISVVGLVTEAKGTAPEMESQSCGAHGGVSTRGMEHIAVFHTWYQVGVESPVKLQLFC